MLKVRIGREGNTPFNFELPATEIDEENFLDNVKISGAIIDEGNFFVVKGKMFCRKKFVCDRCLTEAIENQEHDFEEELNPEEIVDDEIDLTEIVRDNLLAGQPLKNLCKPDCRGLCPVCGKNLNNGRCECDKDFVDPRLAPLKNFISIEEV